MEVRCAGGAHGALVVAPLPIERYLRFKRGTREFAAHGMVNYRNGIERCFEHEHELMEMLRGRGV